MRLAGIDPESEKRIEVYDEKDGNFETVVDISADLIKKHKGILIATEEEKLKEASTV